MFSKSIKALLALLIPLFSFSQVLPNDDCAAALNLCANVSLLSTNATSIADANLPATLCFVPSNGVWYKFKAAANGNVTILISGIVPINGNSELQAAIFSMPAACDIANAIVLDCNAGSTIDFNLNATGLQQGQTYYVLVDGGETLAPSAECAFTIKDTGSAVNPSVQAAAVNATCNKPNGEINLSNVKPRTHPYQFQLNGGAVQSDSSFIDLTPGAYSIVLSDVNGCTFTKNVTINNIGGLTSISTPTTSADCATSQNGSIAVNALPANANYMYSLDGAAPQASNSFPSVIAGTHYITITGTPCDTTVQTIVSLNGGINSAIGVTTVANCGATNGSISYPVVLPAATGGQYLYQLLPNGNPQNTSTFSNVAAGTYQVEIFNSNSPTCRYTDLVTITQLPGPTITDTSLINEVCGDKKGQLKITANGGVPPYTFSNDGGSTFVASSTFTELAKGVYMVVVKDANGCTVTAQITVDETTPGTFTDCSAGEGQTILQGEKAIVEVEAPEGAVITWFPATVSEGTLSNNFKLYPPVSTNYTMTATLANGCVCNTTVAIKVNLPIDIANTFTPNGDDKNDTWLIKNISSYRNVEIDIYDRWGNRVYHNTNYTDETAWDGTSNGSKLPVATYYYVIKFEFPESSNDNNPYYYEGSIALLK